MSEDESFVSDLDIREIEIDGLSKLRKGQYAEAEKLFQEQYSLLLRIQKQQRTRVHKGGPLHNIGIAQLFQGKVENAVDHVIQAYIEDLLWASKPYDVDNAPACRVLRGTFGATWDDLAPIEGRVSSVKALVEGLPTSPEPIYHSIPQAGKKIADNYHAFLDETWQLEIEAQRFAESRDFKRAVAIYQDWYQLLLHYQEARKVIVYKGHLLFNMGIYTIDTSPTEALEFLLLAYVEEILSQRTDQLTQTSTLYSALASIFNIGQDTLRNLERWVRKNKYEGKELSDPRILLDSYKKTSSVSMLAGAKVEPLMMKNLPEAETAAQSKKSVDNLPGKYANRVFIGGNYTTENTLHEIAKYLNECGLTGIVAIDYESPSDSGSPLLNIHDLDVLLIHMCRYAVFELSIAGAEYAEVEWAIRFLYKKSYAVKAEHGSRVSQHVADLFESAGIKIFTYSRNEQLRDYIRSVFCTSMDKK